jgi:hypothetical protein
VQQQIVSVNNVEDLEFSVLVQLLNPIYCKEVPEISVNKPVILAELEKHMIFFTNQYAYMAELWGTMLHHVRTLKRMKMDNKDMIAIAMDKRDFLEKVMSATKLKYYACARLLLYHSKQGGE